MTTKLNNFTDEEFIQIINSSTSMLEIQHKLGYFGEGNNTEVIKNRCLQLGLSLKHLTGSSSSPIQRTKENVFCENSTASQTVLRRWYSKENIDYKCTICGLPGEWQGKPLTLTLDHINGINNDDRLENLRWVCPNCDRQLDTFAGKNVGQKERYNKAEQKYCENCGKPIDKDATRCIQCAHLLQRKVQNRPDREELKQMIRTRTFTDIGRQYNVNDNTIRKWCKSVNLPTRKKDIEQITDFDWINI